jgi:hypothetical protein
MPPKQEVIDLADDDEYDLPLMSADDFEEIEAIPVAGPSRKRDNSYGNGQADYFDLRQEVDAKLAKLDAEVRFRHSFPNPNLTSE